MIWLHWLFYILQAAILVGGLYITLLNLPGLWVMIFGATIYAVATGFRYSGLWTLGIAATIALLAELIDFFAAAAGAKKAGASKRGLWCAVIGGLLAGLFLTIPFPVVGTIIGVCIGTFVGAIVGELWGGTEVKNSLRIGLGAAWGRLLGVLAKLLFGCVIFVVAMFGSMPPFHSLKTSAAVFPASRSPTTARVK